MPSPKPHPPQATAADTTFQTGQILTITLGGHTVHDACSAFFAPLLPKIQEKLSLSYSQIGALTFGFQFPFIATLLLGYLADRMSVRYLVILAPAVTATLMSLMGVASNYWVLMGLIVATGLSVAAFHAPTPAMIGQLSGNRLGLGMSLYMASGELGRTLGPMIVALSVTLFGLEGIWRTMALGWASTALLYWRLHHVPARPVRRDAPETLTHFLRRGARMLVLLCSMVGFRTFIHVALTTYLPLYMRDVLGAAFVRGALSLTILEGAGVVGALLVGPLGDRVSRKHILLVLFTASPIMVFLFMHLPAHLGFWLLPPTGFFVLSTTPVILTILQAHFPRNRALATSTFMSAGVVSRSLITWILGFVADQAGLTAVFHLSIAMSVVSIPLLLMLPSSPSTEAGAH